MSSLSERACEPLQTFVETVTGSSASGLNVPSTLSQTVETQLVCDLGGVHGVWQILLVGENQQNGIPQLILVQHALQLLSGLNNTITIVAINNEDDTLGVLEVMSPERSDLVLSTDIPHCELNVLVLDGLDIETDSGDCGNDLAKLQLIQNGCLSCSIQTDHQNSHLLFAPELVEELGECKTHDCG